MNSKPENPLFVIIVPFVRLKLNEKITPIQKVNLLASYDLSFQRWPVVHNIP